MRALLTITILAVALPPDRPDPTPKVAAKPLQEQIQGEWQLIHSIVAGQTADQNATVGYVYAFDGKRLTARTPQAATPFEYDIVLDPKQKPATIDFVAKSGGNEVTYPGILKLENGTLTLCFQRSLDTARPAEFASPADANIALMQFRRVAK